MSRPVSKHRADVRPRWGRIGLLSAAATVTLIAILAGLGVLSGPSPDELVASDPAGSAASAPTSTAMSPSGTPNAGASGPSGPSGVRTASPVSRGAAVEDDGSAAAASAQASSAEPAPLPPGSGFGRRAVFSQSEQRVWIVGSDGQVERTYPVSGSVEDNLRPGTYHVYGKSRWAVGIDDSGVMQYFVRFTHGTDNGASIGFHSIPTKHGRPLQTLAQLGQRLSHGCIRQKTEDAIAMWNFARVGTEVVVVA